MLKKLRYINYGLVFAYTMMLNELFMPILPTIAKVYQISPAQVQWFLNMFLLGSFLGELFIPLIFCLQRVKNQYQKVIYLLIMMLCISLSIHEIGYLLIARFITGFCSGSMVSLIRIGVEKKERNISNGYIWKLDSTGHVGWTRLLHPYCDWRIQVGRRCFRCPAKSRDYTAQQIAL